MGTTIEEAIDIMERYEMYGFNAQKDGRNMAIKTMRKYQKIQEVMDSRPDDDAKSNSKALGEIEVIMYGNDNG